MEVAQSPGNLIGQDRGAVEIVMSARRASNLRHELEPGREWVADQFERFSLDRPLRAAPDLLSGRPPGGFGASRRFVPVSSMRAKSGLASMKMRPARRRAPNRNINDSN